MKPEVHFQDGGIRHVEYRDRSRCRLSITESNTNKTGWYNETSVTQCRTNF